MRVIAASTWMNLSGAAPLRYTVNGSDSAQLMIGDGRGTCELDCDADAMHSLARAASAAAAEMEALYQQEEAARQAAEHYVPGRHHLQPMES